MSVQPPNITPVNKESSQPISQERGELDGRDVTLNPKAADSGVNPGHITKFLTSLNKIAHDIPMKILDVVERVSKWRADRALKSMTSDLKSMNTATEKYDYHTSIAKSASTWKQKLYDSHIEKEVGIEMFMGKRAEKSTESVLRQAVSLQNQGKLKEASALLATVTERSEYEKVLDNFPELNAGAKNIESNPMRLKPTKEQSKYENENISILTKFIKDPATLADEDKPKVNDFIKYCIGNMDFNVRLSKPISILSKKIEVLKKEIEEEPTWTPHAKKLNEQLSILKKELSVLEDLRTFTFKTTFLNAATSANEKGDNLLNSLKLNLPQETDISEAYNNTVAKTVGNLSYLCGEIKRVGEEKQPFGSDKKANDQYSNQLQVRVADIMDSIKSKGVNEADIDKLTDLKYELFSLKQDDEILNLIQLFRDCDDALTKRCSSPENEAVCTYLSTIQNLSNDPSLPQTASDLQLTRKEYGAISKMAGVEGKGDLFEQLRGKLDEDSELHNIHKISSKSAKIGNTIEFISDLTPSYKSGEILLDDEILKKETMGGEPYTLQGIFQDVLALNIKALYKTATALVADVKRQGIGALKPLGTEGVIHAAIGTKRDNSNQNVAHIIKSFGRQKYGVSDALCCNGFHPNFNKILTTNGLQSLKQLDTYKNQSDESIAKDVLAQYEAEVNRLIAEHTEQWKSSLKFFDGNRAMKSILPSLGKSKAGEEKELLLGGSEKNPKEIFCSDFVGAVTIMALKNVEEKLLSELPETPQQKPALFKQIFPANVQLEKMAPNVLKKYITDKDFFAKSDDPFVVKHLFKSSKK